MAGSRLDRAAADVDAVRNVVAGMHLNRWVDVEPRLLLRMVTKGAGCGEGGVQLALEVVVSVTDRSHQCANAYDPGRAVIPLRGLPVGQWAASHQTIWQAAARNTRRLVRPTMTTFRAAPLQVCLLTGGPSTAAVALDIGYFARAGATGPDQVAACEAAGWWSVLSERAAVIVVSGDDAIRSSAVGLIAELRGETADPLPANLFRYSGRL